MERKRYLMTQSLLSAWQYLLKDDPYSDATTEKDPMAEFMSTLRREPSVPNEAMQKGIDFEALVTDITAGKGDPGHKWYEPASTFADIIRGGQLQYKTMKEVEVGYERADGRIRGLPLLLYGRLDALKAGVIYDIKFSGNYEAGKFIDSTQHPMYLELIPEAYKFAYLVSNGGSAWIEEYVREDVRDIYTIIRQFLNWLSTSGLMEIYKEHWESK